LALQIIERTKIDTIIGELSGFAPQTAVEKLMAGDIDAAFIVTAWDTIVTARLECIRMPQTVCDLRRPALSRPIFMLLVMPIASEFSR
jgi:hypothetical protein